MTSYSLWHITYYCLEYFIVTSGGHGKIRARVLGGQKI